ncbi:MAG TPA: GreA/GreB family elongation factor [Kofleriaceae bacterium]|jgi:transcription elongation GreA/GreB family factor
MSRAFVKEEVDVPEGPTRRRGVPVPELNVVTPAGLVAARAELEALGREGGNADRIHELSDHLATAQALEPADTGIVGLGARVTIELEGGGRATYHIVGAIEADAKRGAINWQSPLAQALWGRRVGDGVTLPKGDAEIVALTY